MLNRMYLWNIFFTTQIEWNPSHSLFYIRLKNLFSGGNLGFSVFPKDPINDCSGFTSNWEEILNFLLICQMFWRLTRLLIWRAVWFSGVQGGLHYLRVPWPSELSPGLSPQQLSDEQRDAQHLDPLPANMVWETFYTFVICTVLKISRRISVTFTVL